MTIDGYPKRKKENSRKNRIVLERKKGGGKRRLEGSRCSKKLALQKLVKIPKNYKKIAE